MLLYYGRTTFPNSYYEKFADGKVVCIDDEIPFEIPESWTWGRLSNMVQINPKNYVDDNKEAAFIPMEKIEATYLSSYTYTVRKWREIKSGYTHFANGDVAFAKITPCFQNRKSMILKSLPNGIGAGTSELKVLRTYSDTISKEYLLFFLESPYFVEEAIFKGTANQQRIISGYLENKLFPLPPLNEQRSIAEKIKNSLVNVERYAKLQDKLEYLNNNLNTFLKKSILQEAIQGKLVPQDPNDEPASVLLQRIKEEKLRLVKEGKLKKKDVVDSIIYKGDDNKYYEQIGKNLIDITDAIPFEIPNNWVWTRLSNVANIYTGNSISETEKKDKYTNVIGRYYIGTKDVGFDNNVFYNNGIAIPKKYEQDFRIAPKDSILMCIEGGSAGRKIAMLNQDVCFGNKLCCFASFIEMGKFIYYYLQSPSFTDMFNQNKAGIIGGVSLAKVKGILIPLPPLKEQFHIINRLDELYAHL
ncbi:restriction endonuclease subunit S [Prevotella melaninogenica]|nr:restriction endonuclease subunit S [Prevotella melaninogenica]